MAAVLALLSAVCFALSAALQQRGQFSLARSGAAVDTTSTDAPRADPAHA